MRIVGVIPARLDSSRLREKVLRPLAGRPMIQHVWQQARRAAALDDLVVACDDPRILQCVQEFGGKAVLTRKDHPNGSSRVAEIAERDGADVFLNIQGDEPLIRPEAIDQLAEVFRAHPAVEVATLAVRREDEEDYHNPAAVKVVCDAHQNALYFSRSPIPHHRDLKAGEKSYLKHLGIYGYRREFLLSFVSWPVSPLEEREKLEQLRILERGCKIRVVVTPYDSWGVDTSEDAQKVEAYLKQEMGRP